MHVGDFSRGGAHRRQTKRGCFCVILWQITGRRKNTLPWFGAVQVERSEMPQRVTQNLAMADRVEAES